jgi:FkbM family methyltransferase
MTRSQWLNEFDASMNQLASLQVPKLALDAIKAAKRVYLLGPSSSIGQIYMPSIVTAFRDWDVQVYLVDDRLAANSSEHNSISVLSTEEFVVEGRQHPGALAVSMVNSVFADGFFRQAADQASVEVLDIIRVLDLLDLPVIYQKAQAMRDETLARLHDYKLLARVFHDELSIRTLEAMITLRITFDRQVMLPVMCGAENEYFAAFAADQSDAFQMGTDEVFVDIGAHRGTIVNKFLLSTNWKFRGIHAFEPDVLNCEALMTGHFANLQNFHAHNLALSDQCSTLRFAQTGTMGSHLDDKGNVEVQAVPLDDVVDYATFVKMDVEGHETNVLRGARKLISTHKPRMAITCYHYADDLLSIAELLADIEPNYRLRLRHHSYYYYDSVLYAHA